MNIAIIGIINHDTITMANGQELQDLGGILYNTSVLANLVGDGASIYPISRIGYDCHAMMQRILQPYPNVDISGIAIAPESRNRIRYDESMEKVEQLTNHIDSIPMTQIEPYLQCDAFLVNFIIGDDISLDVLHEIRSRSKGLVYLDVHNLCLGIDEHGYRFQQTPDCWHDWMRQVDIVQMNEVEAGLLAEKTIATTDDFVEIGKAILDIGPSIFIATRGRHGSITVYRNTDTEKNEGAGKYTVFVCPPEPVEPVVDTTGCGDAFAAGFLTDYLTTRDPVSATRLASWTAGFNCTLAGLSEVGRFRDRR
jgi:sugar/nucleoside kinase (ribokinase family)